MTEPTLTELREMAVKLVEEKRMCPCKLCRNTNGRAVIDAFLSLTDQTPLTAEQCREAGLCAVIGDISFSNGTSIKDTTVFDDFSKPDVLLDSWNPTVGQLRLALLQENNDGE